MVVQFCIQTDFFFYLKNIKKFSFNSNKHALLTFLHLKNLFNVSFIWGTNSLERKIEVLERKINLLCQTLIAPFKCALLFNAHKRRFC